MSTAGGGFKLGPTVWLRGNQYEDWLSSLSLVKQRGSSRSRIAENVWMNFFFPPIAGPLSNNPTWIPNWLPLEMALPPFPFFNLIILLAHRGSFFGLLRNAVICFFASPINFIVSRNKDEN